MSTLEKANIELCPKYSTFASQYNFREVQLYPFQLHILVLNNLTIQEVYICFFKTVRLLSEAWLHLWHRYTKSFLGYKD